MAITPHIHSRFVIIFTSLLLASGCRTIQIPPAPSLFSVDTSEVNKIEQANSLADSFANEKNKEKNPVAKTNLRAETIISAKTNDPAWESLQKLKKGSEKTLTLTELIDIAFLNNPQTRQLWSGIHVAKAIEKQSESAAYPQINVSETITRQKQSAFLGNISYANYGPSAQLTYLILDFGGRSAQIESTFQKVLEASSLYNQSIQDLILNVQTAYYNYHSALSTAEAAELDVENAKTDYDAALQRFNVGLNPKLDVLQAKSNYENALYNFENAKGALKSAKATLAVSIGVPADTNIDIIAPNKELPADLADNSVSELIAESIQIRPDISALRADLKSKRAASRAASSDLLPNLNFGMNAGQDTYKFYNSAGYKKNQYTYSGFLSVNWDIFDGFSNLNKKKQADYETKIAMDKLIQSELEATSQVWIQYYNYYTAVQKLNYGRSFFETAEESYALALESYKNGLKSILDLLSAQSSLSQARSRLIQSKQDVFIALAELAHSIGSPNVKLKLANDSLSTKGDPWTK